MPLAYSGLRLKTVVSWKPWISEIFSLKISHIQHQVMFLLMPNIKDSLSKNPRF